MKYIFECRVRKTQEIIDTISFIAKKKDQSFFDNLKWIANKYFQDTDLILKPVD